MSIQNSNLSKYGYDTVVAVTQKGLNVGISTYYSNAKTFSQVSYYFIKDSSGNAQPIDKLNLLQNYTNNIDPLSTSLSAAQQKALSTTGFYFAFSFIIGNPQNAANVKYLTLNPGSSSVRYYLLCKTLQVAFWNPDNNTWVGIKQMVLKEFNIYADVNLKNVLDNTNLNPAIQAAVDTLGGTDVNVQQLIFDLDSAVVDPNSTLDNIDNTCSVFKPLMQQFANTYFSTYMAQSGALNYAITTKNTSSLVPTEMNWNIGAFVDSNGNAIANPTQDQQDLATLNYLFATNGNSLPTVAQFSWNWLEDNGSSHNPDLDSNADVNKYAGAISINRDAFAQYLISQLNSYAQQNCWAPYIDPGETGNGDLVFSLGALPGDVFRPYNPNNVIFGDPDQLLLYWYNAKVNLPIVQSNNPDDTMCVTCKFSLSVTLGDGDTIPTNRLTIEQNFQLQITANCSSKSYDGSPVNKKYKDVFNMQVDDQGRMLFNRNEALSQNTDLSTNVDLPFDNDWDSTDAYVQSLAAKSFTAFPFTLPQQFVFPGGNAFVFQDAQFVGSSDLVCHVTYKKES